MKKMLLSLTIVTGIASTVSFSVLSNQTPRDTIELCATLLPKGHNFEIDIDVYVDTTSEKMKFSGELGISDGTQVQDPVLSKKTEAFTQCVSKLFK